jgi:formylglycine-generating enzyme required for sulfatase activity
MFPNRFPLLAMGFILIACALAACAGHPAPPSLPPSVQPPLGASTPAPPTATPAPPTATRLPTATLTPALPDPKTDPLAALRHGHFPEGLDSIAFKSTYSIYADPRAEFDNAGYGPETARIEGKLNVVDFAAGKIDMELCISRTLSLVNFHQEIHLIRLGDRAWQLTEGASPMWEEFEAANLDSAEAERMFWGGWHPLYMLEPFDSVTEAKWVETGSLDGKPAHHLHVVFDPAKMRYLNGATKARWEHWLPSLLDPKVANYGKAASADVRADVWLAADDLSVKQIESHIQVVTQQDEGGKGKINWTIIRTLTLEPIAPDAIAEPYIPLPVRVTQTAAPLATGTAVARITATAVARADARATRTVEQLTLAEAAIAAGPVLVPAGEFLMGSAESKQVADDPDAPRHTVYLDAFRIDRVEVTNGMYAKCVAAGACKAPLVWGGGPSQDYQNPDLVNYPVTFVSWSDAQAYCQWAGGRLPTEAEWEKAARGADGWLYPWGNQEPDPGRCNFRELGSTELIGELTPVGGYPAGASPYGALDMAGNADEWVADWFDPAYYKSSPSRNPAGPDTGEERVVRGGNSNDLPWAVHAAWRWQSDPAERSARTGFRCARSE